MEYYTTISILEVSLIVHFHLNNPTRDEVILTPEYSSPVILCLSSCVSLSVALYFYRLKSDSSFRILSGREVSGAFLG